MMKIDQIIRSNRKSIALIVKRDGKLIVRAPLDAKDEQIFSVIQRRNGWIEAKQQEAISTYPQIGKKEYVNGEGFMYLGQSYRLKIIDHGEVPLQLGTYFFLDKSAVDKAERVFSQWYIERASEVIPERVVWYAEKISVNVNRIKITSAKSRWGSCSAKGTLSFPWRLVMGPVPVIDYVVVHELVHLLEKNHGVAFWNKVRTLIPDYKQKIEWMEINGHTLTI